MTARNALISGGLGAAITAWGVAHAVVTDSISLATLALAFLAGSLATSMPFALVGYRAEQRQDTRRGPAGTRPEGVVIHHPDGTSTPCELACAGIDEDGLVAWDVMTPYRLGVDHVTVDVLPAGACVRLPLQKEDRS